MGIRKESESSGYCGEKIFKFIFTTNATYHIYPKERSKDIGSVVKKLSGKSTLIITEQEGMANRGSMINFVLVNSRVRFEINKGNVTRDKLMLSSTLLELSTNVIDK